MAHPAGLLWAQEGEAGRRDYWTLVPTAQEGPANDLMVWRQGDMAPLPLYELSRCKIQYEFQAYERVKAEVSRHQAQLQRRLKWFVTFQRAHDRDLAVGGSPEARELVQKLSRAATENADLSRDLSWIDDATNTVRINLENLRTAASELRVDGAPDELLRADEAEAADCLQQMEFDRVYHHDVGESAEAVLAMTGARLQVGLAHQTREQAALQGVQTSVIASLGSVVALSQFRYLTPTLSGLSAGRFAGLLVAWLVTIFSLCQLALNWTRRRTPVDRASFALAAGLWALWSVSGLSSIPPGWRVSASAAALAAAAGTAYLLFLRFETRPHQEWQALCRSPSGQRDAPLPDDDLLRLVAIARRELPDLLEDLPEPTVYRVKAEQSARGTQRRKGKQVRELSDAIGLRYVVPPHLVPRTIRRVASVLTIGPPDYKRGTYWGVHLDARLHGQGLDPELDLRVEVQVRTPLQNRQAEYSHRHGYKAQSLEGDSRSPTRWERGCNGLWCALCWVESLVFAPWLTPPRGERGGPAPPPDGGRAPGGDP